VIRYVADANVVQDLREDKRAVAAHPARVALHHAQVSADQRRKIGLVDDADWVMPGIANARLR
jgi:hypothetical protein